VYGSLAKGAFNAGSDVDIMVIGNVTFGEIVSILRASQDRLQREVNPTVYPAEEFRTKVASGHHFLTRTLCDSKLFLIGDADELDRLVQPGLADGT
jgi:uncharacterized protein